MHIPDGMLDTKTVLAGWTAALPALAWAVRAVRQRMADSRLVLMSVLAALVFALQMLNFPVAGGTSGHFAGGALVAILLGPWPAVIVIASVLVVQALVFADGGVVALGANMVDMALVAPLLAWWVYSAAVRVRDSRGSRLAAAFVAGWAACVASAVAAALMLWASGVASLPAVVGAMAAWHAIIGIGEGLVTAGIVSYVHAVRPTLLGADAEVMRPRGLIVSLAIAAAAAAGLSFLASQLPDGLESVAADLSFLPAGTQASAPLAGYLMPGAGGGALAGVMAGLVGVIVTGALAFATVRALHRRAAAR